MTSIDETERFAFGKNWSDYVDRSFNADALAEAQRHLAAFLRRDSLSGLTFLDIGSGSGIHSLAAYHLGAERIVSFDYDSDSVATTQRLRAQVGEPSHWEVLQGSVLDPDFMATMPKVDIVYSWGVLHHTGDMWTAVRNAAIPMKPSGDFYIALYSSDNYVEPPPEYWIRVKRRYNSAGPLRRRLMEWRYVTRFHILPELKQGRNPFRGINAYSPRGMTFWTDVRDWLGGWPMEFASLAETREFCRRELGLTLMDVITGQGCTEYIFCDPEQNGHWGRVEAARTQHPLPAPYQAVAGNAYRAELPDRSESADGPDTPFASPLMVYEDGLMLGLAHASHDHIRRFGRGRFSHWGDHVIFSTSDNSDPNSNGRSYTFCPCF